MAAPTAGMCDVPTPAMISATGHASLGRRSAAIAFDRASPADHHLHVLVLGDTRLLAGQLLKRHPVEGGELVGVVDVAAQLEDSQPLSLRHRLALLRREREAVEVG